MSEREIRIIPERTMFSLDIPKALRVAAYCRVSNPSDEQGLSLHAQTRYYTELIDSKPRWINAGVFSETATGLNTKKRPAFNALLRNCRAGKIDMILTKSISRFGRNTLDTVRALRMLQGLNADVWFEQEGLHLLDERSRLIIEIYCALAQNESEDKSQNIRWGIKAGFQSGNSGLQNRICYGYRFDEAQQELVVVSEEAQVVRLIFHLRLQGKSYGAIAKRLAELQISSPTGKPTWNRECIRKLLQNEKYVGDVILQKTYVEDLFTGKQRKNAGKLDKFLYRDNHEAIISREVFEQVSQITK